MEMFAKATRHAFRYNSTKGALTTEQLWELPLTGAFSLNAVATEVTNSIKSMGEDSFVEVTPNPDLALAKKKLEVLKYVRDYKLEEKAAAKQKAAERAAKRAKLLEILNNKENEAMSAMSKEEIMRELDKP